MQATHLNLFVATNGQPIQFSVRVNRPDALSAALTEQQMQCCGYGQFGGGWGWVADMEEQGEMDGWTGKEEEPPGARPHGHATRG